MNNGPDYLVNNRNDSTPFTTRIILITVLAVTTSVIATFLLGWIDPASSSDTAATLWLFTGLFMLRVFGQVLVAIRPQQWLPPMEQWNFIPYPILLPIQIVFIIVMVWIDFAFTLNTGISISKNPDAGNFLIFFSYAYVMAMVIRYTIKMYRRPDQRWFGGTIPIVFHIVLASYLYVLGNFYVSA